MKLKKKSFGDIVLDFMIYTLLLGMAFVCLYPMWYILMASFTNSTELAANPGFLLWPKQFVGNAYKMVFENPRFLTSFCNSIKCFNMFSTFHQN